MEQRQKRILLIDDNAATLQIVASVLERSGFEIRTSLDLEHATNTLAEWRPDLILTDVNLPGTSGVEICRRLKATYETAHVPVVLFSATPRAELEVLARTCEADGFVTKSDLATLAGELSLLLET
ncbi:MAG: response regulator [Myxococcota bacterium]|nr:response regulator [Myxococcota bacterium]